MIIAWVLCMIMVLSGLVSQLGHSAALQIRLVVIEQEAHKAFVAAEKQLARCEAQISNTTPLALQNEDDASTACDITIVDANATAELIRIRAPRNAIPKNPIPSQSNRAKQTQMELIVYRDKQSQTIERLSWRMLPPVSSLVMCRLF